jgi:nitrous oxidase accessory protein NosD
MKKRSLRDRRLRWEYLEERRMLAVFTVDDDFTANDPAARQFTTIQAAVDAATAGDKIKVRAGTYEENVVINKQLKIEGADASLANYRDATKASIVDPVNNTATGAMGIAFDLQAEGIEIEGFTIGEFDTNTDANGTIGIRTSAAFAGYAIKDNVVEANTVGIYLNSDTSTASTPARTEVEDNVIRNNNRAGTNTGNGIFSDQGLQNAKIKDNLFSGTNSKTSIWIVGAGSGETATLQSDISI